MQITRLTADEVKSMYEKHGAALAAYACSCGLDHSSAEDVVQQLFLKMLGKKAFIPQAPLAYLYRATRNASLNVRRDRHRETNFQETDPWLTHPGGNQIEILFLRELRNARDPGATYEKLMGQSMPSGAKAPNSEDVRNYREYMKAVQAALNMPPDTARMQLSALER